MLGAFACFFNGIVNTICTLLKVSGCHGGFKQLRFQFCTVHTGRTDPVPLGGSHIATGNCFLETHKRVRRVFCVYASLTGSNSHTNDGVSCCFHVNAGRCKGRHGIKHGVILITCFVRKGQNFIRDLLDFFHALAGRDHQLLNSRYLIFILLKTRRNRICAGNCLLRQIGKAVCQVLDHTATCNLKSAELSLYFINGFFQD